MDAFIDARINEWLLGDYDTETKNEIQRMLRENPEELNDAFYKSLEFGTGGLRGIMGVGTNRMNKYTVGAATQGLANYLKQQFPSGDLKVAIAYDSRNNSAFFAQTAADILSANGIRTYLFEELRSTPELSFAVRYLDCNAGIVITASHNPKEYNGYKVYWNDGGQLVPPHDINLIKEVLKIDKLDKVKWEKQPGLIEMIGEKVDEAYIEQVRSLSLNPDIITKQKNLNIVYTPLHGTGITMVPRALHAFGFEKVSVVDEQAVPDGNFPTAPYPNPEERSTLMMALQKADAIGADLVMATDPDADRVGIAVRNEQGEMVLLNGNEMASLLTWYILSEKKKKGLLHENDFIVKTIVTTNLMRDIADSFHTPCYNVLTGFKYIAEKIREFEGKSRFICGGEESYGFLIGDFVRDKDAISTCCLVAELAAFMAEKGQTLTRLLENLYLDYAYYKETQVSITKKGKAGAEEIKAIMDQYRTNPPETIGTGKVTGIIDYQSGKNHDCISGNTIETGLPVSNVLQFVTGDGTLVTVRPSGTEPKIKFYISVKHKITKREDLMKTERLLNDRIESITESLNVK